VGPQLRTAINTGEALVELQSRPDQGEGMASGDVVNTTARWHKGAPPNGLLRGETTYRATSVAITYGVAERIDAKRNASAAGPARTIRSAHP
jgi:class 3 adenylate cyclase